ncbi:BICD family-like cargo adapter 1 isoform X1 [Senna tora]|uniref:BICD family-like cargo adapter 1 isoform X1 n=1 Tax=Senna tora TaxID=362788 RepID=A0A834X602_9FABA|nr:BICD family-like cargo adapter 1 isoform X1 [Senna tora]
MEEEDHKPKHVCRLCSKRFLCGRSLGGHMRSHIAYTSQPKLSATNLSTATINGYGLRQKRKKTWRIANPSDDTHCGNKGFVSCKALFGHMKSHSHKQGASNFNNNNIFQEQDSSWTTSSSSSSSEQEEVAMSLMMLSRDMSPWGFHQMGSDKTAKRSKLWGSHHIPRSGFMMNKAKKLDSDEEEDDNDNEKESKKRKGHHECPICLKVFASGQALGGHKRTHLGVSHRRKDQGGVLIEEAVREFNIDLNLPAVIEEDSNNNGSHCESYRSSSSSPWWVLGGTHKKEILVLFNLFTQMSNRTRSRSDTSFNVEELLKIGARCIELRKEKNRLKISHSRSFEQLQMLELHEKSLSEFHTEDKRHIERLEKELLNYSQEIDYLQDLLNAKDKEVINLKECVYSLKLNLEEMESLQEEVFRLREELQISNSEKFILMQQLETKEMELDKLAFSTEKLEESISSITLESQCEVESMKLDMMALEQSFFEAKKIQDETVEENTRMNKLIEELQVAFQEAQKVISSLDEENRELKEKLSTANMGTQCFLQKVEDWLENNDRSQLNCQSSLSEQKSSSIISQDTSAYGEELDLLLARLARVLENKADSKGELEKMYRQMEEYEFLVEKLKEELREEKLKAKEEAEELAQEMAELRYQITGLLEEECKRRACIEQASLQRIAELEAQRLALVKVLQFFSSELSKSEEFVSEAAKEPKWLLGGAFAIMGCND